jgi:mRNA interferase RelE/StbE
VNYKVEQRPRARRELEKLPLPVRERIGHAILRLELDPRPHGCLKMKGVEEWRLRVGTYRVRYRIDDSGRTVTITNVAHRKDAYSDF